MATRKPRFNAKLLVDRARHASGNAKYALHRMPKGHWMRTDQAKKIRKARSHPLAKKGIKAYG
jgi:hypothetical protein